MTRRRLTIGLLLLPLVVVLYLLRSPPPEPFDFIEHFHEAVIDRPEGAAELPSGERLAFLEGFEEPREVVPGQDPPENLGGDRTQESSLEGDHALRLERPSGKPGLPPRASFSRLAPAEPVTRYRFVAYIRAGEPGAKLSPDNVGFRLLEMESGSGDPAAPGAETVRLSHADLGAALEVEGDPSGWMRIDYSFVTLPRTDSLMIIGYLGRAEGGPSRVLFDAIHLWKLPAQGTVLKSLEPHVGDYKIGQESRRSIALPLPCTMSTRVTVPDDAILELALGAPANPGGAAGRDVILEISALDPSGRAQPLLQETVAPGADWVDLQVPLPDLGGREIDLRFSVRSSTEREGAGEDRASQTGALLAHPILHSSEPRPREPVVLLISIDTLRADHCTHLGYPRSTTPHLDRLAREGVTFSQAESVSSWTLPGHTALLTGTFPSYHFAEDGAGANALRPGIPTVSTLLSAAGYFCGAYVTHLYVSEIYGLDRGFHTFHYDQDAPADRVVDRALAWLERHGDRPSFLFLHLFDPHADYAPPEPYDRLFDPDYEGEMTGEFLRFLKPFKDPGNVPAPRDLRHVVALYDGEIRKTDHEIGRLLAGLDRLGMADRAVIVVTSDHGEEFRDHGSMEHSETLYEEILNVPLILHGLPFRGAGSLHSRPVRLVDVVPTLLDALGHLGDGLPGTGGVSLLPLIRGEEMSVPPVYARTMLERSPKSAMREGSEKIIRDERERSLHLYDLDSDPSESEDLARTDPFGPALLSSGMDRFFRSQVQDGRDLEAAGGETVELNEEQEDLLRGLGYIE